MFFMTKINFSCLLHWMNIFIAYFVIIQDSTLISYLSGMFH